MSLSAIRSDVKQLVRDGAEVLQDPADYDFVIRQAVKRYARAKARRVVTDIPGTGAFDYDLPVTYLHEYSRLESVEYPAGQREPEFVDGADYMIYQSPSGYKLRFLSSAPAVGSVIRVTFTGAHDIAEATTSVPEQDFDVLTLLAAALACESLSSHYSNSGDSTIGADSVDHRSKAAEYALRAKRFFSLADELLPMPEKDDVRAASKTASWGEQQDPPPLTHRLR